MLTIHPSRDFCLGVEISHNGQYQNLLKELQFLFSVENPLKDWFTADDRRHEDVFPLEIDGFYIFNVWDNKLFVHPGVVWQLCKQLNLKFSKKHLQNFINDETQSQMKCRNVYYKSFYLHSFDLFKQSLLELPLKVIAEPPGLKRAQLEMVWEITILKKNFYELILATL